ncbi:MAG TPA: hypothetical protein VEU62_14795, partial [Bryobacterales bacterium]|nr:hypothetical protein [Bryobacterales bacterium]
MPRLALLFLAASTLLAQPAHWWDREPLRILDYVSAFGSGRVESPAALAARKAALGFNAEHLEVMGMDRGLDDQEFRFHSKVAAKINED